MGEWWGRGAGVNRVSGRGGDACDILHAHFSKVCGVCWRRSGEFTTEGRVIQGAVCGFGRAVPGDVVEEGGMERKTKEKTTIFQEAKTCLAVLFLLSSTYTTYLYLTYCFFVRRLPECTVQIYHIYLSELYTFSCIQSLSSPSFPSSILLYDQTEPFSSYNSPTTNAH